MPDVRKDDLHDLLARVVSADPSRLIDGNALWAIRGEYAAVPRVPLRHRALLADKYALPVDGYHVTADGIAVIELGGPLSKWASAWRLWGLSAEPTLGELTDFVARAAADSQIQGIMLYIDSPGGTAWGTSELADAVTAARAVKPVHAYAADQCCSAAYWIGSTAERLTSNAIADVGSIGVYALLVDSSKMATDLGLKFLRLRTGAHKGVGVPGVEITDAELAELQRGVDSTHALFLAAIAAGRPQLASSLGELADGRCWQGAEAAALQLTDGVEPFDAALDHLRQAIGARQGGSPAREKQTMSDPTKPAATASATPTDPPAKSAREIELEAALAAATAATAAATAATAAAEAKAVDAAANAKVDRDLAALSAKVPPAVLQRDSTRTLLVSLHKGGDATAYQSALDLVAGCDASALLGEPLAGGSEGELKPVATATGLLPAHRAQLEAAGMNAAEIAAHAQKMGVN